VWVACQWSLESSLVFNEGSTIVLSGDLQVDALRRALQAVVDRHEALRTTFLPDGSAQLVASSLEMDVTLLDLSDLDAGDRRTRRAACIQAESDTPFDLTTGPLIRASLLRYGPTKHELVLGCHHLICDGVSFGVLLGDLAAIYTADVERRPLSLAPAAQFREFAAWQGDESRLPEAAADEEYWLRQFAAGIPVLDLPLDRQRPATLTYAGAVERLVVSGRLFDRVRQAASRTGNTPFAVLLAAYRALLGRLTGQDTIVIGISSSGQALSGSQGLVGHGVNFLPLNIGSAATPAAQLQVVRDVLLDAFDHQNYTFGRLVRKLILSRSAGRVPLVSATFNLDPKPGTLRFGPIAAVDRGLDKRHVNFDLHLNVTETNDGLVVDCNYLTDVYDPATIRRWLGYYTTLLEAFTADSDAPLASIQLADPKERELVSRSWQGAARAYPDHATLNELFEAQVARSPESIAVISGHTQWSYSRRAVRRRTIRRRCSPGISRRRSTPVTATGSRSAEPRRAWRSSTRVAHAPSTSASSPRPRASSTPAATSTRTPCWRGSARRTAPGRGRPFPRSAPLRLSRPHAAS
jgi:hypothetical protein